MAQNQRRSTATVLKRAVCIRAPVRTNQLLHLSNKPPSAMEVDGGGEGGEVLATVPLSPGGRLHVAWGTGNELLLAAVPAAQQCGGPSDISAPQSSDQLNGTANVQWCVAAVAQQWL